VNIALSALLAAASVLMADPMHANAQPLPQVPADQCRHIGVGGLMGWINQNNLLPKRVVEIRDFDEPGPGINANADWINRQCHAVLVFADGQTESGIMSIDTPLGPYAAIRIRWMPDCLGRPYDSFPNGCVTIKP
jgi:hypothetical protein